MDESTRAFEMNVKSLKGAAFTGLLPSASIFEAAKEYGRNFEVNLNMPWKLLSVLKIKCYFLKLYHVKTHFLK